MYDTASRYGPVSVPWQHNERWSLDKEEQRFDPPSGCGLLTNDFTSLSAT
jgi:hypothetical protein